MSRITRFSGRDPGPAARMSGFLTHLRENGLRLGVGETELALAGLTCIKAARVAETRSALKAICSGCKEDIERFDDLFAAYWMNDGRVRTKITTSQAQSSFTGASTSNKTGSDQSDKAGTPEAPQNCEEEAESDGIGKLIASKTSNLKRTDLRNLIQPEDVTKAEQIAEKLGQALKDRRSRRRRAASKGDRLHFRKIIRKSLASGGEPIQLVHKKRPDRRKKIAAICDVSGSMTIYARVFLAFLMGLMRNDPKTDAYLFHTRLVRISEAMRDKDALRALTRMSLMADGFGGGSKIGASLDRYQRSYAKHFVDGRTVVLILSDGYDTGPQDHLAMALAKLKKRGCKIIWLNPLKSWREYQPIANGMAMALPYIDIFKAAGTLEDLAALETELTFL